MLHVPAFSSALLCEREDLTRSPGILDTRVHYGPAAVGKRMGVQKSLRNRTTTFPLQSM